MNRLLSIVFVMTVLSSTAQERFFNFVDGWVNNYSTEEENGYLLWGLGSGGSHPFAHNFTQNHIYFTGQSLETYSFQNQDYVSTTHRTTSQMVVRRNDSISVFVGSVGLSFDPIEFEGVLIEYNNQTQTYSLLSTYQENSFTQFYSIVNPNDSTYLITAHYTDDETTRHSVLYNIDLNGEIRWQNDYYCDFWCDTYPQYILPLSNGHTAVLLREFDDDQPFLMERERALLVLLDEEGNELWRDYPGDEEGYRLWPGALLEGDGEILVSFTDPYYFDEDDQYQIHYESTIHFERYDYAGQFLNSINLDGQIPNGNSEIDQGVFHEINQMLWTNDGRIIISGHTGSQGILGKLDSDLNLIWYRLYRAVAFDENPVFQHTHLYHVLQTGDDGYLCTGQYQSDPGPIYPQGIQTAIALKVDEYGCLEPGCQLADGLFEYQASDISLKVWPNPTTGELRVELPEGLFSLDIERIEIHDELGRIVISNGVQSSTNDGELLLDLNSLTSGIYVLQLITSAQIYSSKIIKE